MAREQFMIGGELVEVPEAVEARTEKEGRAAIADWYAEQDEPHALKLAAEKKIDLKHPKLVRSGYGGRLASSDVERFILAEAAEKTAAAEAVASKKAEKGTPDAPAPGTE